MSDDLIPYAQWKKLTSLPGRPRSKLLREQRNKAWTIVRKIINA